MHHYVSRHFHPLAGEALGPRKWATAEDDALRSLVAQHGTKWADIGPALGVPPDAAKDRWRLIRDATKHGAWSPDEARRAPCRPQRY